MRAPRSPNPAAVVRRLTISPKSLNSESSPAAFAVEMSLMRTDPVVGCGASSIGRLETPMNSNQSCSVSDVFLRSGDNGIPILHQSGGSKPSSSLSGTGFSQPYRVPTVTDRGSRFPIVTEW